MSKKSILIIFMIFLVFSNYFVVYADNQQGYILGPEDVLDIRVWNHPDFATNTIVRPDGYITLPVMGEIEAQGMTPSQLATLIKGRLQAVIKEPEVSVAVVEFKKMEVSVLGAVEHPGVFKVEPDTRILEVLAEAGILEANSKLEEVSLTRNDTVFKIDVEKLLREGGSKNYLLKPKDVIYVPQVTRQVYILGEVEKPGAYAIYKNTTPVEVLAMAGGPSERADLKKVKIIRNGDTEFPKTIDLADYLEHTEREEVICIQDGDIIQIEETRSINWEKIFAYAAGIKIIHDLIVNW